MLKALLFCILVLSNFASMAAQSSRSKIESVVFVHSYIEKIGGELIQDESSLSGVMNVDEQSKTLKERTWIIPNRLGTGFEIGIAFLSIPEHVNNLDVRISYPEMILPSGEKRSQLNRQVDITGHNGEYIWGFAYYFDYPYEATPGDWYIEIHAKGNLVHSSKFTVVEDDKEFE
ncbi:MULTISPECIES: DUF3859 domain-containing protein [Pseudoalteromonas]|uniref:DUF3859 domain-containing protein n=1 Tax=Pseudoalteromonas obscura TaxID=3048491 RepID=A0ABT7EL25_9GAMM|nr:MULTISPECIES: DUF3859 domain-containing protein [Pseudoalteromonas]MBQ4837667.1 DUF3859 domain-containing protein [Pseudoalteromonas luteoviolacea]MDK2595752.1 DUF3859 domain-containing protein [Pseudoalteromonas sp. P94(2023)]